MTDIRYVGTSNWERTLVKDGKVSGVEVVKPGDTITVDEDSANKLAGPNTPRTYRNFVMVGSSEDPESKDYEPGAYDAVQGNASVYPKLEMGSTVQPGRAIFATEDDNPDGYALAGKNEGPRSDNEDAILEEQVQQEARSSANKKREELTRSRQQESKSRQSAPVRRDDSKPQGQA